MIEHFTKTYTATIRLDGTTDSYDLEKPVISILVPEEISKSLSKNSIEQIIRDNFLGNISQIPPNYSAVWIDGRRAYDLARKGHEMEIKSKERRIESFEVLSYSWPRIEICTTVSHGTYIRSLARDLGKKL